uniref:Uncharacterized protein n=1 Tax=Bionectria ochroleuca TaxID=29856 RepID=A0A8H7TQA3_BIOOC
MLLSSFITPLALIASTVVVAYPVDTRTSGVLVARTIPSKFAEHAAAAIKAFGPLHTKTMMHSGIGAIKASKVARSKKLQTVETTIFLAINADKTENEYKDTLKKYCITKEQFCDSGAGTEADWKKAWGIISTAWANYVNKETTLVTTAAGPAADSFYKTFEEPILKSNNIQIHVDKE